MTWYLVLSIGLACPGGWFSGLVPQAVRPYICAKKPHADIFPRNTDAYKRLRELGPDTLLLECRGLKCQEVEVKWRQVVDIKGEK